MKEIFIVIIIFITVLFSEAQWVQLGQDIDGDVSHRSLGASVCISGNGSVVAIGASGYPENGVYGLVRVFTNQSGNWVQIGNDIIVEYDAYWSSNSISMNSDGTIIAIGALGNSDNGYNSGSVRIFQNQSNNWVQVGNDINGEAAEDMFGYSISINSDGSIIAIGAYGNDESYNAAGQVKVFQNQSNNWVQIGNSINGVEEGEILGWSLSLNSDGSIIAIGASGNDGNASDVGSARIYKYETNTWLQIGDDIVGDLADDWFGTTISINSDGSVVAIGAPYSYVMTGYVKVFKNDSNIWTQIGSNIEGQLSYREFGCSISLNSEGSIIVIGATSCYDGYCAGGYVNVYQNSSNIWNQINDTIFKEYSNDNFGKSVDVNTDGSVIIVGASCNNENGYISSGHARVYKNSNVSIPKINKGKFNIYPNPTTGQITIESENIQQVEVYNISGVLVKSTTSNIINIGEQAKGVYFVKLIGERGVSTQKIILE